MEAELPSQLRGENGFKNFLWYAWHQIGLPDPTPIQYEIADWMQHGPDRQITEAFRGVGKSYIACGYTVYSWLLNPALIFLVCSGSKNRADNFSVFVHQLIEACGDLTHHLLPHADQRSSKIEFDVGPAPYSGSPSCTSKGILSQITGSRGDVIIADDVMTSQNSQTPTMRDKIEEATNEFNAIIKPDGRILYLMTPQTEQDLSQKLPEKGYAVRIWPAEIPSKRVIDQHGENLGPTIKQMIKDGVAEGTPTDPLRFDEEDLLERKVGYGRSGYAMQFLLDHSLADQDRYPLKIPELIITDLDPDFCKEKYVWASGPDQRYRELHCVGFNGDYYYRPMETVGEMVKYQGAVMAVDPSGRGRDETAYGVVATYGGQLFLLELQGIDGGFGPEVLLKIAHAAKRNKVGIMVVEENFGQGMFASLMQPVLQSIGYSCQIELIRHNIQKERRICDVLEPVINSHKLIVNRSVVENDWKSVQTRPPDEQARYQMFYQLSRITRDRGSLRNDDRLDVLAMACQYWVDAMRQDTETKMKDASEERRDKALQDFMRHALGTKTPATGNCWISKW